MTEVDFFNKAIDKTSDDILDYWANSFQPMEQAFYNIIREWFIGILGGEYDEHDPFECDITIKQEFPTDDYPVDPCIIGIWYDQETDEVFFDEALLGGFSKALSEYPISDLVQIVQGLKEDDLLCE